LRKSLFSISTCGSREKAPEIRRDAAKLAVRYSHVQNSVPAGNTVFAMAALTVNIGSFTTWLNRKCIATLHNK
jgi:plastocyanin